MIDSTAYALVATAAVTGVLHILIPDHWLPFVLMGRAQGWGAGKVLRVSGLAALVHTALSALLGLAALGLGLGAAEAIGERIEEVASVLLVIFGLAYAFWSWRKGGHFHPGGSLLHAHETSGACEGLEGPENPEHLHYHADESLIAGHGRRGSAWLAVIVGLNPCVLVVPVVLAASPHGTRVTVLVVLAYLVPTALVMIGLSVLGVSVGWKVRLPWAARIMEPASGLIIAALGLTYWIAGH